jgi:hypothetical protein
VRKISKEKMRDATVPVHTEASRLDSPVMLFPAEQRRRECNIHPDSEDLAMPQVRRALPGWGNRNPDKYKRHSSGQAIVHNKSAYFDLNSERKESL